MKTVIRNPEYIRRMQQAFDLFQAAEDIKVQSLRRQNPDISPAELRQALDAWRISRPGAELGDSPGRLAWHRFPEWAPSSNKH
jgi:hypothetical protein